MAIVRTIKGRWGGAIQVADDQYRGRSAGEIEALRAETRRAAGGILRRVALEERDTAPRGAGIYREQQQKGRA